jgi:DHA1 family bicyclomycin/chloramphenicol resistance-like MFS transporter
MPPEPNKPSWPIAAFVAALTMFGPFSIDAIFPGFPAIANELRANPILMQQLISCYLAGFAAMSLFHGPLSDAFGRRPVIIGSTALFVLSSIGAALSPNVWFLLGCRLVQGCAAGGGVVVGRAMIRDVASGASAQKMLSNVMLIFGLAPTIAPIVGAILLSFGSWRLIFLGVALFSATLLAYALFRLHESLPKENRVRFRPDELLATYRQIGADLRFLILAITPSLNFGAIFVYISSAPRLIFDFLHRSPNDFYMLFVPIVFGMMTGAWASGRASMHWPMSRTLGTGYILMMLACTVNLLLNWIFPQPRLPWAVLPLALQGFGMALTQPGLILLALDRFPAHRGAASAVQALFGLILMTLISGLLSPILSISPQRLAIGMLSIEVASVLLWAMSGHRQPVVEAESATKASATGS